MGSSDDERKAIDASIGGLVWVRRRNGSWWPGRIMAHHEVPDGSGTIVSPKCGTPIKLLGRDDASVDWYNLDKSKRVKAFRCGEYAACIETAKAASSSSNGKKGMKYARREDAIVHALEIENALLVGEATDVVKGLKVQSLLEKRRRSHNDSGGEGIKRMRGVEDVGNTQVGSLLEAKQENGFTDERHVNGSMSNGSLPNGNRKRLPVVSGNEYYKRKTRQRPLPKVLESTDMVSVPFTSDKAPPPGVSESKVSTIINNSDNIGVSCEDVAVSLNVSEDVDTVRNKGKDSEIFVDDSSKELFDVPLTGEEKYSAGILTVALTSSNGSASTSPATTVINGIEKSTSMWRLKGKRNSRKMSKKQEERRNAFAQRANSSSLLRCSASDQNPRGHFSVGTQAMGRNSQLYDVKIEVNASYKPREVPLISLRSKLNGEAIIGHPLTIEVLEYGSCDRIVSSHIKSLGVPLIEPKPSWKNKSKIKKPHNTLHKSSRSKKASPLSKKTRCLSALSGQKVTVIGKKKVVTEAAKEQVVACVPLKVAFSRISEAVKGSGRQVHKALPSAGNT